MKLLLAGAAGILLASTFGASAQNAGPYYDSSIHQSARDTGSAATIPTASSRAASRWTTP